MKSLCLNMIVRNEMANLERCLTSVVPHIACWIIGDTGSTDGTQDFIRTFFARYGLPGELHEFPFHNFEQARNAALDHAYASPLTYDYLLFDDADMELVVDDADFRGDLTAPGYRLLQRADGLAYWNTRLIRRDSGARYRGVTHEYVDVAGDVPELQGVWYKDHANGSNRPDKFERDIRLLTEALAHEPENGRYWFYLAQSCRDAGRTAEAAEIYAKRADMGGWDEEAWYARLQHARCLRTLGDYGGFLREALRAFDQRPQRGEPLHDIAAYYRHQSMNSAAALFSVPLGEMRQPNDLLFVESHVYAGQTMSCLDRANAANDRYDHATAVLAAAEGLKATPDDDGLRQAYSVAAAYLEKGSEERKRGFDLCNGLALDRSASSPVRDAARRNLSFYAPLLSEIAEVKLHQIDPFRMPDGYYPCNPSLAWHDGRLMMMLRTVNYQIMEDGSYWIPPEHNGQIRTRNYLCRMSASMTIEVALEIRWDGPESREFSGIEDLRIVSHDNALWCSGTVCTLEPNGQRQIVFGRIEGNAIVDWHVIEVTPGRDEKNWMPFDAGEGVHFVYSPEDHRVIDCLGREVSRDTQQPYAADHLRGGAFDLDEWTVITHEVCHVGRRKYLHRFIRDGISKPFYLARSGAIEFACGLAIKDKQALIGFGVEDGEAWIAEISTDEIERLTNG